jgi:hypothetical protein
MMLNMKIASFALAAITAVGSTGCVVRARGTVSGPPPAYVEVDEEPPAPRVWITETRPGYVYVQGRWERRGGRWDWRDGRWERERANQGWVDGRWERRGNRHVYVEGRWEARQGRVRPDPGSSGGVRTDDNVRDHRDNPPPPPQDNGPVIRDHRR